MTERERLEKAIKELRDEAECSAGLPDIKIELSQGSADAILAALLREREPDAWRGYGVYFDGRLMCIGDLWQSAAFPTEDAAFTFLDEWGVDGLDYDVRPISVSARDASVEPEPGREET